MKTLSLSLAYGEVNAKERGMDIEGFCLIFI